MAPATQDDILKYAVQLLKRYRCGFDNCTANFYYKPMTDELRFGALGNNGDLYFIYVLGNEPRYDEFLKALAITRWIDPIC